MFIFVVVAQIDQPYPDLAPLQHMPSVTILVCLLFVQAKRPFSSMALLSIFTFIALHTVGGRYIYSNVPYDAWVEAILGLRPGDVFGWQRNQYDRLVHLMFGVSAMLPLCEVVRWYWRIMVRDAVLLSIAFVFAVSAIYEIFEWLLTLVMAGPAAENYNGQQGDIWDAQKDMALAGIGAFVAAGM
ncbi:MAG: DUF2238 domain-containing protein, partial [Pseudomonadota bacterium]